MRVGKSLGVGAHEAGIADGAGGIGGLSVGAHPVRDRRRTGAAGVAPVVGAAAAYAVGIPNVVVSAGSFHEKIIGRVEPGAIHIDTNTFHQSEGEGSLAGRHADGSIALEAGVVAPAAEAGNRRVRPGGTGDIGVLAGE